MADDLLQSCKSLMSNKNRRRFLKYMVSGTVGISAVGWLFSKRGQSREPELENLCSYFPKNPRCENYLPGVEALDRQGKPIHADTLLTSSKPGDRILAKGLPRNAYLVIGQGPKIAEYAISSVCAHLGCTVGWHPEQNRFICPCHGSQYDAEGRVVRGPARRSLPLLTLVVKQNQVRLVNVPLAVDPRQ
jgi:cytochrome b6-f complex iron-sulfur subunit